jgi:hypothetical protein
LYDLYRDFHDYCRDNAAIFRILARRGTAIFGLHYGNKFLPLMVIQAAFKSLETTTENSIIGTMNLIIHRGFD